MNNLISLKTARESTYGPLLLDRPLYLLSNDKGQYCCESYNPIVSIIFSDPRIFHPNCYSRAKQFDLTAQQKPVWAGHVCYKLSQNFHPEQWSLQRMMEVYGFPTLNP